MDNKRRRNLEVRTISFNTAKGVRTSEEPLESDLQTETGKHEETG